MRDPRARLRQAIHPRPRRRTAMQAPAEVIELPSAWAAGAAYIDGRVVPVAEATIPVTDWGYRRSDVTYDVVSVWDGAFFKLDDHLRRFRNSMKHFRLDPRLSDDD